MWVPRLIALVFLVLLGACGGKSVKTIGGEAGAGAVCEDTVCDGECIDTSRDTLNCGRCGARCNRSETCEGGRCTVSSVCPAPNTLCGGQCVDLRFSQGNCGGCGTTCTGGLCSNGVCVPQCTSGQCGARCVDFNTDPGNCGGCGITCGPAQYCNGGRCQNFCEGASCDGICVDLSSDPNNCGGCGYQCLGADLACIQGICEEVCPPDTIFCSGVCVDWRFDSANCGGCGLRCADGQQCSIGACTSVCPPNGSFCGGQCVDLTSNPSHCGGCFNACPSMVCSGSRCTSSACGDRVVGPGEEGDPPPGPLMIAPLTAACRYDLSAITQWYCHGSCGNWGGGDDCDQSDANAFCRLKMDNPRATALSFAIGTARPEPGVCCPPPSFAPSALGCTSLGTLSSRGVDLLVSVHPTNLFSTHQGGRVITNLVCTDP